MKRFISAILFLVMLVAAVQPTVAVHFCGGNFHSIGIGEGKRSCCPVVCPEGELAGDVSLSEPVASCCSDYAIEIATDSCQQPPVVSLGDVFQTVFACLPVYLSYEAVSLPLLSDVSFPPGGLAKHNTNILLLHCTLQI